VAAGEDQSQPLVGNARGHRFVHDGLVFGDCSERRELRDASAQRALAPQPVDRAVARDGDDPCQRVTGYAVARPLFGRRRVRVLDGFFGQVPVADGANQRRDRPPEVLPVQPADGADSHPLAQDVARPAPAAAPDSQAS
jgi:hypothetical protein